MANNGLAAVEKPRIEVLLVPDEGADLNPAGTLFDIWLVLHVLDGRAPETIRVDGGPYDRSAAATKLAQIWVGIGEQHAEAARGGRGANE